MSMRIITLADAESGSTARILPEFGFNCFEFRACAAGQTVDVLWSADGLTEGRERASGSGIPILFPFPGRIRGTAFRWEGKEYPLEPGDGRGNAIHGFVLDRPWRVLEQTSSQATAQFQASRDDPDLLRRWPSDFRITATYDLRGATLDSRFTLENPGEAPLPWGFGTHAYFRVPLGGASANECRVQIPAAASWQLDGMLPTGKVLPLPNAKAFRAGVRFGDLRMDDVLTGLEFDGPVCRTSIHDPSSGRVLRLSFDRTFRECVVYNPPHRQAICIEPYTLLAGAFSLDLPHEQTGLRVMPPGGSVTARVTISVE